MKSSLYPMKSIGLSDLGTDLVRFIALRAMLVSDRSYGAERHRMRSSVPTEHPDTSIACSIAKGCEHTDPTPSQGLKDHLDTSIACSIAKGCEHTDPTPSQGLKDHLDISLARSIAKGCEYTDPTPSLGLKDHLDISLARSIAKGSESTNPTPSLGLKDHPDTSIARQGYEQIHPGFLGLKDRWIFSLVGASASNPA